MNSVFCRCCGQLETIPTFEISSPIRIWPFTSSFIKNVILSKKYQLVVYQCAKCGLVQLQHFELKFIKKLYRGEYLNQTSDNTLRLKSIGNIINLIENQKIRYLDIGGASNPVLINNSRVIRYSVDPGIKEQSKYEIRKTIEDFETNKTFHIISMFHTLEHLENPRKILFKLREMLEINGRLIIEVPNLEYYLSRLPYYTFFHQHITVYSKSTLYNLVQKCGFTIEKDASTDEVLYLVLMLSPNQTIETLNFELFDFQKIFSRFRKSLIQKVKDLDNFSIYGAGGSTTLLLNHFKFLTHNLFKVYDQDKRKIGKYIPGQKVKVCAPPKGILMEPTLFLSRNIFDLVKKDLEIQAPIILEDF